MRSRIAVLVSGRGSNLKALIDFLAKSGDGASCEIAAVLSSKSDAPALDFARRSGIPAESFSADDDGSELSALLDRFRVELIVLSGYLKKVPPGAVAKYAGRIVNVHPGLLPSRGGAGMYGAKVHEAVIAAGDRESGVTVHLVDDEYDRGPIVAQWRVPVNAGDDAESLGRRVLRAEHVLYPRVIDLVAALLQLGSK